MSTAATVHEQLQEANVDVDWVNDERVDTTIDDVIWMVIMVECDGRIRLVEVLGCSHPNREVLSMLPLAL